MAHRLVGGVRRMVSHPRWWRSRKVYSHTTVVWSHGWMVNVYVVARPRWGRPRTWRLRPRRRPRRRLTPRCTWWRRRPRVPRTGVAPGLWNRLVLAFHKRRRYLTVGAAQWWSTEMTRQVGHPVGWRWIRLRPHTGGATTLLAVVRYNLRGRGFRGAAGVIRPLVRAAARTGRVLGGSIRCAGRFTRKQRADYKVHRWGHLLRSGVGAHVEEARLVLPLKFGAVAVTLTLRFA